jgi:hypothetical protein
MPWQVIDPHLIQRRVNFAFAHFGEQTARELGFYLNTPDTAKPEGYEKFVARLRFARKACDRLEQAAKILETSSISHSNEFAQHFRKMATLIGEGRSSVRSTMTPQVAKEFAVALGVALRMRTFVLSKHKTAQAGILQMGFRYAQLFTSIRPPMHFRSVEEMFSLAVLAEEQFAASPLPDGDETPLIAVLIDPITASGKKGRSNGKLYIDLVRNLQFSLVTYSPNEQIEAELQRQGYGCKLDRDSEPGISVQKSTIREARITRDQLLSQGISSIADLIKSGTARIGENIPGTIRTWRDEIRSICKDPAEDFFAFKSGPFALATYLSRIFSTAEVWDNRQHFVQGEILAIEKAICTAIALDPRSALQKPLLKDLKRGVPSRTLNDLLKALGAPLAGDSQVLTKEVFDILCDVVGVVPAKRAQAVREFELLRRIRDLHMTGELSQIVAAAPHIREMNRMDIMATRFQIGEGESFTGAFLLRHLGVTSGPTLHRMLNPLFSSPIERTLQWVEIAKIEDNSFPELQQFRLGDIFDLFALTRAFRVSIDKLLEVDSSRSQASAQFRHASCVYVKMRFAILTDFFEQFPEEFQFEQYQEMQHALGRLETHTEHESLRETKTALTTSVRVYLADRSHLYTGSIAGSSDHYVIAHDQEYPNCQLISLQHEGENHVIARVWQGAVREGWQVMHVRPSKKNAQTLLPPKAGCALALGVQYLISRDQLCGHIVFVEGFWDLGKTLHERVSANQVYVYTGILKGPPHLRAWSIRTLLSEPQWRMPPIPRELQEALSVRSFIRGLETVREVLPTPIVEVQEKIRAFPIAEEFKVALEGLISTELNEGSSPWIDLGPIKDVIAEVMACNAQAISLPHVLRWSLRLQTTGLITKPPLPYREETLFKRRYRETAVSALRLFDEVLRQNTESNNTDNITSLHTLYAQEMPKLVRMVGRYSDWNHRVDALISSFRAAVIDLTPPPSQT